MWVTCVDLKMIDNKARMKPVIDVELLLESIHAEKLELTEAFPVKLPLTWNMFKGYLKHKGKEITMVELIERINVHEQYMSIAQGVPIVPMRTIFSAKANVVEHGQTSTRHDVKGKQKKQKWLIQGPKGSV